jgi:hypothetical protein
MAKKQYVWFIEALDDHTNEVIGKALQEAAEESLVRITPTDKRQRKAWRCSFDFLSSLEKSQAALGLKFKVYNQMGNGQIRPCPAFLRKPRQRIKMPIQKQTANQ